MRNSFRVEPILRKFLSVREEPIRDGVTALEKPSSSLRE